MAQKLAGPEKREIDRMWGMFSSASKHLGTWAVKLAENRPQSPRAVLRIFPLANSYCLPPEPENLGDISQTSLDEGYIETNTSSAEQRML